MTPNPNADMPTVLVYPEDPTRMEGFGPFSADMLDEPVFCIFFRETEQRTAFLKSLKLLAGQSVKPDVDADKLTREIANEYARFWDCGNTTEALMCLLRWRCAVLGRGYHAYSLKAGFEPYRTSCLLSFRELETLELRMCVARGMHLMENDKSRVLGFFGLDGE